MNSVYHALAAARAEFPPVVKDRVADTGKYKYTYADLGTVLEAVTPTLRKHKLEIVQSVRESALQTLLVYLEADDDAEFVLDSFVRLPLDASSQALGSAITYARRYAIVTLLGLTTEEDDDGNAAATPPDQGVLRSVRGATNTEAPPALPEGWFSREDCQQAHEQVVNRITGLSPEKRELCSAFKAEHGWPLPAKRLAELNELVDNLG